MKQYIYKRPKVQLASFNIVYNYSAINEGVGYRGTSHLMEHLICHSLDDLRSEFTKNGIQFNAYTQDNFVVFYINGLEEKVQMFKELFINRITSSFNITEEQFENEKQIVLQEYKDAFARVTGNVMCNLMRRYFDYGGPIGYASDIEAFTLDKARELYDMIFRFPTRIIDITRQPLNDETLSKIHFSKGVTPRKLKYGTYDNEREPIDSDRHTCVNMTKHFITKADYPYVSIGMKMLTHGLESPLYTKLREERGLTYSVLGYVGAVSHKQAFAIIMNNTSDTNKSKECLSIYNDVLENLETYMTQERFDDIISMTAIDLKTDKLTIWDNVADLYEPMVVKESDLKKMTLDKVIKVTKKYLCKKNLYQNVIFHNAEMTETIKERYERMAKSKAFQDSLKDDSPIEIDE